jgi:threonine dehydratase
MKKTKLVFADFQKAKQVLDRYLKPTPLLFNSWLSQKYGCQIYLKLENMQPIGSFKIRGATYKISQLSEKDKRRGVIAASAGNHAQGVAWGSKKLGVDALIVMPRGAPLVKIQNTKALGAEVILEGEVYEESYAAAMKIARKTGRVFVHAFDDPLVIAGQGTVGLEIIEQLPDVDVVVGSMGGGGLLAGVGSVIQVEAPHVKIIGCQAKGSSTIVKSVYTHHLTKIKKAETFADGIAVTVTHPRMYGILRNLLDQAIEVDDEATAAAVLTLIEKAKVVTEGAGAIALAAFEKVHAKYRGKKVVLILSGGNIDVNVLSRIIDRGLTRAGRRVRVNVLLKDRPGSLAHLTQLIADQGSNILQAIHDRSEPSTTIDQTEVALTLETRGPEHSRKLLKALRGHVLKLETFE